MPGPAARERRDGPLAAGLPHAHGRLVRHAGERRAPPDGQLLRYPNGRRITYRRYDDLWDRLGRYLPWVRTQQISTHWLRHTTLTWVKGRGVASDATFGTSREHALPAAQRTALWDTQHARAPPQQR